MEAGGSACARCHHSLGPAPAGGMLSAAGRRQKGTMQGGAASKGPAVPGTQER